MRRPTVCFVSDGAYPLLADRMGTLHVGGAELQQVLLGEELARRGYRVSFVTPDYGQGSDTRLGPIRVLGGWRPEQGLPVVRFFYPRLIGLWRAMARADADFYLVRTASQRLATVVGFARLHGRRSVYCAASDTDFEPHRLWLPSLHDRWMYSWGLQRCHAIVSQSERQRVALRQNFGRSSAVIPNGYPSPARLGSGGDRVLWVATFRKLKRPRLLLEVAERLPTVTFVMVGGPSRGHGEDRALFDSVAAEAARLRNVDFLGALPLGRTESQLDRASVVVNTSSYEGFPNTFLQAWSRGIPVVSFFDPDGLIRKHRLGVAVEDVEGMVRALRDLQEHRIRFSREQIREFFEAHFSLQRLGDRYERFFASLRPDR